MRRKKSVTLTFGSLMWSKRIASRWYDPHRKPLACGSFALKSPSRQSRESRDRKRGEGRMKRRGYFLPSSCGGGVIGGSFGHANCSYCKASAWVGVRRHHWGSYMLRLKSSLGFLFHMTSPPSTSCTCCQLLTNGLSNAPVCMWIHTDFVCASVPLMHGLLCVCQ